MRIKFHGLDDGEVDLKSAFQVRSAYRNESDFHIQRLQAARSEDAGPRIARIIDVDKSVSKNYERMAWKGMQDLHRDAPEDLTIGEYRRTSLGDLQKAMRGLFTHPELALQDFGGIQAGSFRFTKGGVSDFHYKNLSGGEKAAFDILLDVFVKRDEAGEAVFCIDEPELHVATDLQGPLIASILGLLPESTQLWIATHSIGIVREAYRMQQEQPGEVAFLDFSGRDFGAPVTIAPSVPNRVFWENTYKVALDDLSSLVAPQRVVICEGSREKNVKAFDARCYNELFADESPETLFISQGGAREVIRSEHLVAVLKSVAHGINVHKLVDRDDMTDGEEDAEDRSRNPRAAPTGARGVPLRCGSPAHVPRNGSLRGRCGRGAGRTGFAAETAGGAGQSQGRVAGVVSEDPRCYGAAEPREQAGGIRVAVSGTGAPRNVVRLRGTPGGRVR